MIDQLLKEIRSCTYCLEHLPEGVNPVLSVHSESKIAIVGQAPGRLVHESGIPWDDKSGDRLRNWLGVDHSQFYDSKYFAIIPMGFCFPGRGKSGDLPPRKECAPLWHSKLFNQINDLQLIILIGSCSQSFYLKDKNNRNLTEKVKNFADYLPQYFVLPHPSPRNNIWIKKNPWFEEKTIPVLQDLVEKIIT